MQSSSKIKGIMQTCVGTKIVLSSEFKIRNDSFRLFTVNHDFPCISYLNEAQVKMLKSLLNLSGGNGAHIYLRGSWVCKGSANHLTVSYLMLRGFYSHND